ncbi:N-acetylmuramoyl-L-alanine amidase [Flavobacterium nackdongense]|uniref:N-acetylmuramoyl-L-alanine amidase n=1 Tax=Flavobacterium nackdongense TaxID=2547394 RepID=A0A4P6YHB5_9FLAO|nr:N-acetylmuramoyl-L-alanine amidase [Flavobacterium nackdongense]QBN20324.1 N-acetylmuramoyl-L-alanine amidase [Flavobacterium nackdongense]
MTTNLKNFFCTAFASLFLCSLSFAQNHSQFTVILDAGHGGKDPGNSYHGFVEKEIALKTTLKVGEILEKEKGIKVIYTRTSDVFIELSKRPKIANKANANLFISVHCNSVKNFTPSGTETFVMGLSRSDMNLEVAKNENSVILLENNYKETYQGFNPKKPESLIGLTMMQEENLNNSINLATKIQNNFTHNLDRNTRGVKQQPLWVLDAAYMPGVLIELGFLSNFEEGKFLNSDEGQYKMALQIANAIKSYKKDYLGEEGVRSTPTEVKEKPVHPIETSEKLKTDSSKKDSIYKIQLFAGTQKIELDSKSFKGLKNISTTFSNNMYRYMYGETTNKEEAKKLKSEAQKTGFSGAYIVLIKDGKASPVKDIDKF